MLENRKVLVFRTKVSPMENGENKFSLGDKNGTLHMQALPPGVMVSTKTRQFLVPWTNVTGCEFEMEEELEEVHNGIDNLPPKRRGRPPLNKANEL